MVLIAKLANIEFNVFNYVPVPALSAVTAMTLLVRGWEDYRTSTNTTPPVSKSFLGDLAALLTEILGLYGVHWMALILSSILLWTYTITCRNWSQDLFLF